MDNIAITVIIPVYNVESYLRECLDSVLVQTYQNYEIVCIDDASWDSSGKILEEYAQKYDKLRYIKYREHKGVSVARNTGIEMARGDYICFLDSDDMLADEKVLENLYYMAEKWKAEMVYFDFETFCDESKVLEKRLYNKKITLCTGKDLFCDLIEKEKMISAICRIFVKKEFLDIHNILFYEGIIHEDELFTILCMMNSKRVLRWEQVNYLYRIHSGSIMTTFTYHRAQSMYVILSELYAYWFQNNFSHREHLAWEKYYSILFNTYKIYRNYERKGQELDVVEHPAMKCLYHLLQTDKQPLFNAKQIKSIAEREYVIIYGAGVVAMDTIAELNNLEVPIYSIAVSDKKNNPEELLGIKVREITDFLSIKEKAVIVMAVKPCFKEEIRDYLKELSFTNIVEVKEK